MDIYHHWGSETLRHIKSGVTYHRQICVLWWRKNLPIVVGNEAYARIAGLEKRCVSYGYNTDKMMLV